MGKSTLGSGLVMAGFAFFVVASSFSACGGDDDRPKVLTNTSTSSSSGGGAGGAGGAGGDGGSSTSTSTSGGGEGGSSTSTSGGGQGGSGQGGEGGTPAHCSNQAKDGNETDEDCGGPDCPACDDLLDCLLPSDCTSNNCVNNICAPPTCLDFIENGNETDVDCGGANCGPCDDFEGCLNPSDCTSGVCTSLICQAPTCVDSVTNGDETDTDCGGSCPGDCLFGQGCGDANDCIGPKCTSNVCVCPDGMDIVPSLGGGSYCIGQTEVTYLDYEVFYAANPPVSGQVAHCQWNQDYTPDFNWPNTTKTLPVTGVNWCEAYAYCAWKGGGRRLCGKIGGGGNSYNDWADANASQWFNACSAQGNNIYAYGNTYDPQECFGGDYTPNVGLHSVQNMQGVALDTDCAGGAPFIYHMSGNAWEWEDSCNGASGNTDSCHVRGGSYSSNPYLLKCAATDSQTNLQMQTHVRDYSAPDLSFRCCI
ncbi:MAG: SUMF1/EgtB/PvdO family nonheme iron enzyme [Deltaproteobacteria bacterium]|nr:SUMF1/EgtB/PvdO family nonheme iron enzyme [Deltaproteobacteria bacterium]